MRVLCIGDSLGLPREECPYELTWFYQLQKAFPRHEFIDYFKRGLLISDALHMFDTYYQFYRADLVIIQTGICDCSPRYINDQKRSVAAIKLLFKRLGLENLFWKIVKLRKRRQSCVYTSFESFKTKYELLVHKLITSGASRVVLIKIGHAAPSVLPRNPQMNSNVDKYNTIMNQLSVENSDKVIVLEPLKESNDENYIDGYHCNPKGMDIVFRQIKTVISQIDAKAK